MKSWQDELVIGYLCLVSNDHNFLVSRVNKFNFGKLYQAKLLIFPKSACIYNILVFAFPRLIDFWSVRNVHLRRIYALGSQCIIGEVFKVRHPWHFFQSDENSSIPPPQRISQRSEDWFMIRDADAGCGCWDRKCITTKSKRFNICNSVGCQLVLRFLWTRRTVDHDRPDILNSWLYPRLLSNLVSNGVFIF